MTLSKSDGLEKILDIYGEGGERNGEGTGEGGRKKERESRKEQRRRECTCGRQGRKLPAKDAAMVELVYGRGK